MSRLPHNPELYDPSFEHDACGVGFVAHVGRAPSHDVIAFGLRGLANLHHRGATGSDTSSGDGAGVLLQQPDAFLRAVAEEHGIALPPLYAAGLVFVPQEREAQRPIRALLERVAQEEGCKVLGWREVPVNRGAAGAVAAACSPAFVHVFVGSGPMRDAERFERVLYLVRKRVEHALGERAGPDDGTYIVSLSARTLIYKGMLTGKQLPHFFPDLRDVRMASRFAVVHQRFSTNTLPSWSLAQPFRWVAHNGEFNTVRGNINWMRTRQASCASPLWGDDLQKILPVVRDAACDSDTATFDGVLELLALSGRSLPHAVMMMIPEAWQKHTTMGVKRRDFYRYHAALMEAWDGPAAVVFTDGRLVGACLDRNGLRPARYHVTDDGWICLASEAGVFDVPAERIVQSGRVQPGRMVLVDTDVGAMLDDETVKDTLAAAQPYGTWLNKYAVHLDALPAAASAPVQEVCLTRRQALFGYTHEELRLLLRPLAQGAEALGSMGYDAPLAVLSERPRLLFDYFKQAFAQVTNPPLDALREELVTALASTVGPEANLLATEPTACHQVELPLPLLDREQMAKLYELRTASLRSCTLDITYRAYGDGEDLRRALEAVAQCAGQAVRRGDGILILSDRNADAARVPIPSLLATAAVHHHLIREGLRTRCGLVVDCGDAREVHHMALLLGYGAGAVHPHVACDSVEAESDDPRAIGRAIVAWSKGVLKVMSKMGICTLQSYCGAQLFEAVGIAQACIDRYFTWTPSRIGGIDLDVIAREAQLRHDAAYVRAETPHTSNADGDYQWRARGEYHLFNPATVLKLQHATQDGQYQIFREFTELLDGPQAPVATLRHLLRFAPTRRPIPLGDVEPIEAILPRFATGAMSYGSISAEAHETLAVAMNRIGGKSNSGEGGEDPGRYERLPNGDSRRSAIKQIASGRFGVTSEYLVQANDLQIKIAQGAKPGEGGQLPGHKVVPWIAKVRFATPGVGLISPPPHHDIYSIEDLAQLIYDLKSANPQACVLVKLVAAAGVGTIAAGVAKAQADAVLISGYDGGTGAAPVGSLKHCGIPWELGLAETQQVLRRNGLRDRLVVQVDGHMKTGRDVAVAALLGAEEFGFSTAVLVVSGCIMMRVCHLNTCPVGIATQDPALRERFAGRPEFVVRYFEYVAHQTREIMASLGYARMDDMIGDARALAPRTDSLPWKAHGLDLRAMLHMGDAGAKRAVRKPAPAKLSFDTRILPNCRRALAGEEVAEVVGVVRNTDRSVGTRLGYELTRRHGGAGLPPHSLTLRLRGVAGQSFGAFVPRGMALHLEGEANDYIGKGLSGGVLTVRPERERKGSAAAPMLIGNVALYGATGGALYVAGCGGERFAVRNSGASAVVEGVGDHGCEYMTGGHVVVLGAIGRNFAAGMSGGIAYLFDEADGAHVNGADVTVQPLSAEDAHVVRELLAHHARYTGSAKAKRLLRTWRGSSGAFAKVMPRDYERALQAQAAAAARSWQAEAAHA